MQKSPEQGLRASIDFLPASFREHHEQRTVHLWQLLTLGVLAVMLSAASLYRHHVRQSFETRIAALVPEYSATEADEMRLKTLEQQLEQTETTARLVAYLHHPWPRSQILSALLPSLTDSITLTSITLDEVAGGAPSTGVAGIRNYQAENPLNGSKHNLTDPSKLLRAEQDLVKLREQHDRAETVVVLAGVTTEPGALYAYLGGLSHNRLFVKAELVSLESVAGSGPRTTSASRRVRFRAQLVVRPGYGQPNGPEGADGRVARSRVTEIARGATP